MNTARKYTSPGIHHAVVTQGILQASTVHTWDFSRPKRRPLWQTALMALCLGGCALVLGTETVLWLVSR